MKTYYDSKHLSQFDKVFITSAIKICTRADEELLWVDNPKPPWQCIYHLGNNKAVLQLIKTYYELKQLSHLHKVFIT